LHTLVPATLNKRRSGQRPGRHDQVNAKNIELYDWKGPQGHKRPAGHDFERGLSRL
jgi:hypothetical protein